jgi:hypothetical protein
MSITVMSSSETTVYQTAQLTEENGSLIIHPSCTAKPQYKIHTKGTINTMPIPQLSLCDTGTKQILAITTHHQLLFPS